MGATSGPSTAQRHLQTHHGAWARQAPPPGSGDGACSALDTQGCCEHPAHTCARGVSRWGLGSQRGGSWGRRGSDSEGPLEPQIPLVIQAERPLLPTGAATPAKFTSERVRLCRGRGAGVQLLLTRAAAPRPLKAAGRSQHPPGCGLPVPVAVALLRLAGLPGLALGPEGHLGALSIQDLPAPLALCPIRRGGAAGSASHTLPGPTPRMLHGPRP